jgi:hypothetical protein
VKVITTTPQLTDTEKKQLRNWLLKALVAEEYCCYFDAAYLLPKLTLWADGTPRLLAPNSYWTIQDTKIYIGYDTRRETPAKDCLVVLLALTQFVDRTPELEKVISTALIKFLSGEATTLHKAALIEAPVPMEGVAFSDDKVAMLLAGEWMTAAGETVDVTGWQVYANQLPAAAVVAEAAKAEVQVEF